MKTDSILDTIHRALDSAGLRAEAGASGEIRATIERALQGAGLGGPSSREHADTVDAPAHPPGQAASPDSDGAVFVDRVHTSRHGTRGYKLFVPALADGGARPLVVMLHGCKQDPDDFAAGTRMNQLAQTHGFLVAYPAQSKRANGGNCWNWFEPEQQVREGAEPALIAGIVADIGREHALDPRRIFVAGLSAGAAMAVILGQTYPELFAAVAAHSGLPVGAAHDVASAFAAMHGNAGAPAARSAAAQAPTRTIVFHGEADATVAPGNGLAIVAQALAAFARKGVALRRAQQSGASGGRSWTCTEHVDDFGVVQVEECLVRGGGHAWYGGSPQGSYTDAGGPDASREIVRFFLQDLPAA